MSSPPAAPLLDQLDRRPVQRASQVDIGKVERGRRGADPIVDLTWWVVAIAGCVALALCIAAVLLRPVDAERRQLRPLANAAA